MAAAVASHSLTARPGEGGGVWRWRAGKPTWPLQGGLRFPWEAEQHPKRGGAGAGTGGLGAPGREDRLKGIPSRLVL